MTFQRSPDWLEARKRDREAALRFEVTKAADDQEAALVRALEALERAEHVFASLAERTDQSASETDEQMLLNACKDVIAKRRRVLSELREALREMAPAGATASTG